MEELPKETVISLSSTRLWYARLLMYFLFGILFGSANERRDWPLLQVESRARKVHCRRIAGMYLEERVQVNHYCTMLCGLLWSPGSTQAQQA